MAAELTIVVHRARSLPPLRLQKPKDMHVFKPFALGTAQNPRFPLYLFSPSTPVLRDLLSQIS